MQIDDLAFYNCKNLSECELNEDSKLKSLNDNLFNSSSLKSIVIPSQVKQIGKFSFSYCKQFKQIEFSSKSKLKSICDDAFSYSLIENIVIPN